MRSIPCQVVVATMMFAIVMIETVHAADVDASALRIRDVPVDPALVATFSELGIVCHTVAIDVPAEHSLCVIYRVYLNGKLDPTRSVQIRRVGQESTRHESFGWLDPDNVNPEPSPKIRLLGFGLPNERAWLTVGEEKIVAINGNRQTPPAFDGRGETQIWRLAVNQPWEETAEGGRMQSDRRMSEAPVYISVTCRVEPWTEQDRKRLEDVTGGFTIFLPVESNK